MNPTWLFLAAYSFSGLAGLIYQTAWMRLLTLYMGHSVAAASTVVGAFMGGLAGGSALGGWLAARATRRQALFAYALLETFVIVTALALPWELTRLLPLLARAYQDGAGGPLFPTVRLLSCFLLVLAPAIALGATFPAGVRWFVAEPERPGRGGGSLYAANTIGATVGVLLGGFWLIPAIGISGTTLVGIAASGVSIACALALSTVRFEADTADVGTHAVRLKADATDDRVSGVSRTRHEPTRRHRTRRPRGAGAAGRPTQESSTPTGPWLATTVLALSGFATFVYEITWVRVLSLVIGPTTYAFGATLAALIGGTACGAAAGAWLAGRARRPAAWLAVILAATAVATSWTTSAAGHDLPRRVMEQLSGGATTDGYLLTWPAIFGAALILPTAVGLGLAFPLALELVGGEGPLAFRLGAVYAVNTLAALAGSLVAGFAAIPLLGLQNTLRLVSALLVLAAAIALFSVRLPRSVRLAAASAAVGALAVWSVSPPWDRELLASGIYKYALNTSSNVDTETALTAGTLLYYRDGAASTVSVKRLAGSLALSIDGKVDASTSGDMLTQKVLAHLPLLLHPQPREALVIGLGSGVTVASALLHPISRLDVLEISPEVVEASRLFAAENHDALDDRRVHLVLGDGRSHLLLSPRKYDVIVSEPSNPWMAGVAALFTREFFSAARARLAPGGIICQWAHTYDISDADLRSIAATFLSVFPNGTMWLIGGGDLLLVASDGPLDSRLQAIDEAWRRPGVAEDLRAESVYEPFALLSSFIGGPRELARYGAGSALQTDDRMTLEFSGPRGLYLTASDGIAGTLRTLLDRQHAPPAVRHARETATADRWRGRGEMMLAVQEGGQAYEAYLEALALDPLDPAALDGMVRAAIVTNRETDAIARLESALTKEPRSSGVRAALSKILATSGRIDDAIAAAEGGLAIEPGNLALLAQLASILADVRDVHRLETVVAKLRRTHPEAAPSHYYAAELQFLQQRYDDAARFAREAISRDPHDADARNLLGASYASLGQRDAARHAFDAALRIDARNPSIYVNVGILELESGNRAAAARTFAEALSLDPDSEAAQHGLAEARAR